MGRGPSREWPSRQLERWAWDEGGTPRLEVMHTSVITAEGKRSVMETPEESHGWGAGVEEEPGWLAARKPKEVKSGGNGGGQAQLQ